MMGRKFVEVFDASTQHGPLRVSGQAVLQKDRQLRSEVLCLGQKAGLLMPGQSRENLDLQLSSLVCQIFFFSNKAFSLEAVVTDSQFKKRKIHFCSCRELVKTSEQARVPSRHIFKDRWNNLCLDLQSYVHGCWGTDFSYLNRFRVTGMCRLKRVFALNAPLKDSNAKLSEQTDFLPVHYDLPTTQVIQHLEFNSCVDPRPGESVVPRPKKLTGFLPKFKTKSHNPFVIQSIRHQSEKLYEPAVVRTRHKTLFYQEVSVSPEPMLKHSAPGYFDSIFCNLTKIRHHTPPLVNTEQGLNYDPVAKKYFMYPIKA